MENTSYDVTCPHCGTEWQLDDAEAQQAEFLCSDCNTSFPVRPALQKSADAASALTTALTCRYQNAYAVAKTIDGVGVVVKSIGAFVGVGVILASMIALSQGIPFPFALIGAVIGVIAGGIFFVFGIFISALGESIAASLDCAVNGSPFLSNDDRATIMSLPGGGNGSAMS